MDTSIEQLVMAYLDGDLDEAGARRLGEHLDSHAADRAEFVALTGQDRAMAILLGPTADLTAQVLNELRARGNGGRFVGQVLERLPRRAGRRRLPIALVAALILVAVGVAIWFAGRERTDPERPGPTPAVALAAGWRIEPTGPAAYRVVAPDRVRLDRGELRVESTAPAAGEPARPTLNIDTPAGTASATGTTFYIGTHIEASQWKGTPMSRLTRVFVLAGVVALSNPLGTVTGGPNDLLAAETGSAPTKHAVQANSDFAFDLYRQLAKENPGKNMFFSPYSVSSALAMTVEGARGRTADEMGEVLRFPKATRRVGNDAQRIPWRTSLIHTGIAELNRRLNGGVADPARAEKIRKQVEQLRGKLAGALFYADKEKLRAQIRELDAQVDQYELAVANALWGERTYPFDQRFINTINESYDTGGVFPVNFRGNAEAERVRINAWVEKQTRYRIKDLIPQGALDAFTRLVLTNAIYFKGDWSGPFDVKHTQEREFTLADGTPTKAPIMRAPKLSVGRYGAFNADGSFFNTPALIQGRQDPKGLYPAAGGFAVMELPYKGEDLSMVVIAPNDPRGLPAVEKQLTSANVNLWVGQLKKRQTDVYLPKFKLELEYTLGKSGANKTLQKMGMELAFSRRKADFSGMNSSQRIELYISLVVHKAFVEVNEEGTEAAAATGVVVTQESMPPTYPFTPVFKADRPFVFLIREKSTGSILFMGRMQKPTD